MENRLGNKMSKQGDYYRILSNAEGKAKADRYFGRLEYSPYNFDTATSRRIKKLKFDNLDNNWRPKPHGYMPRGNN